MSVLEPHARLETAARAPRASRIVPAGLAGLGLGALSRLADSAPETVSRLGRERGTPRVAAGALLAGALAAEALAVLVLGLLAFVALVQARRAAG